MSAVARAIFGLLVFSFVFLPFAALAKEGEPTPRVYEGTVGASPVVVKLEGEGDGVSGQYFYRSKRFDIDLFGEEKNGALQLESRLTADKLRLKLEGSNYAGELTTKSGKTLAVQLRAVGPDAARDLPDDLPGDLGLYEKLQLSGLTLKPEKTATIAGRNIRWQVEPSSGNRLFRIENDYPAPAMEAINKALAQIQWREVSQYFGCPSAEGGAGIENSEASSPWLSDAYVSFSISDSWSCAGAAHPDFGMEGHSFDAQTGKEIALDDFIKFGKGPVPAKDTDAWYDYRSKTFAPGLVALLKRFHPKEMAKRKKDDDCDYSQTEVWDFPAWHLTEKGLYVGASFARAMRVCDNPEWAVIPWSALNKQKSRQ